MVTNPCSAENHIISAKGKEGKEGLKPEDIIIGESVRYPTGMQ